MGGYLGQLNGYGLLMAGSLLQPYGWEASRS